MYLSGGALELKKDHRTGTLQDVEVEQVGLLPVLQTATYIPYKLFTYTYKGTTQTSATQMNK